MTFPIAQIVPRDMDSATRLHDTLWLWQTCVCTYRSRHLSVTHRVERRGRKEERKDSVNASLTKVTFTQLPLRSRDMAHRRILACRSMSPLSNYILRPSPVSVSTINPVARCDSISCCDERASGFIAVVLIPVGIWLDAIKYLHTDPSWAHRDISPELRS